MDEADVDELDIVLANTSQDGSRRASNELIFVVFDQEKFGVWQNFGLKNWPFSNSDQSQRMFSNRTMSTSGGTVVYGCDNSYGKSADGILKIIQIVLGFLAWAMFASLPYYKEVFVQASFWSLSIW